MNCASARYDFGEALSVYTSRFYRARFCIEQRLDLVILHVDGRLGHRVVLVPRIPIAPSCLNGIALRFMRLLIKRFFSVEPSVEIQNILRIQELVLYELCNVVERVVLVGVREVYVAVAVGRTVDLVFDCQPKPWRSSSEAAHRTHITAEAILAALHTVASVALRTAWTHPHTEDCG